MKKLLFCSFAALALFCACEGIDPQVNEEEGVAITSLTATTAPATRTSTNSSLQVLWSEGDQIAVYGNATNPETATPFTLTSGAGGTTGNFTGSTVHCGSTAFAVYPYYESYQGLSAGHITTFIPKTQTYVEGSIPEKAFVMAASFNPADGNMAFVPISAVLEVKLYGTASVTKIQVDEYANESSVGGKHLSQAQYIYFEGGTPKIYDDVTSGSSTVILNCPSAVSLGADADHATSFFIVVGANGSFHHLKVTVTDSDGRTHVKNTKNVSGDPVSLTSGKVYSLPAFAVNVAETTNLATWGIGSGYSYTWATPSSGTTLQGAEVLSSNIATASGGTNKDNSTIRFINGSGTTWRTASSGSRGFIAVFVNEGDFWLIQSSGLNLLAGDKIDLSAYMVMYRVPVPYKYEVQYYIGNLDTSSLAAMNSVTWTKVQDVVLTAATTSSSGAGVAIDTADSIVIPSNMSNTTVNIRVIATNNVSLDDSTAPSSQGQVDLKGGKASGTAMTLDLIR